MGQEFDLQEYQKAGQLAGGFFTGGFRIRKFNRCFAGIRENQDTAIFPGIHTSSHCLDQLFREVLWLYASRG
jgi:hypothetical protein